MAIDPREAFPADLGDVRDISRIAGGLSCYARMAAGTLSPSEPHGQATIAVALFKQCE